GSTVATCRFGPRCRARPNRGKTKAARFAHARWELRAPSSCGNSNHARFLRTSEPLPNPESSSQRAAMPRPLRTGRVLRIVDDPSSPAQSRDGKLKSVLPYRIVIPLVLGIVASLAIAVYAEFGFRRLEVANRQMAVALEMESALHEALGLIVDAETGQRGYLLTGKDEYLQPYQAALPKI